MGHKRNRGFTPRSTFEANKEKRGGRVLKIFRMVDRDQASLMEVACLIFPGAAIYLT